MNRLLLIGVLAAIGTGIAIGLQATVNSRTGAAVGAVRAGLFTNIFGGLLAGAVAGVVWLLVRDRGAPIAGDMWGWLAFAGALGVVVIVGVAFSLPRTGVTAGIAALVLGQLLISTIADAFGWGNAGAIPVTPARVAGLIVMGLALYLLLPRS